MRGAAGNTRFAGSFGADAPFRGCSGQAGPV